MSRRTNRLAAVAMATALMLMNVSSVFATVWTDQADYSPGSVVTISGDNSNGAGYLPGETVHVDVSGPNGYTSSCDAVVDANGAWSCQVTLWASDLAGGDYTYTALGLSSGATETGTFTDTPATNVDTLLTLTLSSSAIALGASTTLSGNLTADPADSDSAGNPVPVGRTVNINSYPNAGCTGSATLINAATTGAGGAYSYVYTPASAGTEYIQAHFAQYSPGTVTWKASDSPCRTLVIDAAPSVSSTTPADGATGVTTDSNVSITFTEAVTAAAGWYDITCGSSGTHAAAQSGGPTTFTLNPTVDFDPGETCTVTVYAADITDNDTTDPPDNMAADYVFSFDTDAAPSVTTTTPGDGDSGVALNANITINFSEAIHATDTWYDITCTLSGAHTATVAGTTTSKTLDPDVDFDPGETCTVTVYAAEVKDNDTDDPPQTMVADYVFSFDTAAAAVTPTLTTEVRDASSDAPGTSFPDNSSVYDHASVDSGAEGTVDFALYSGSDCTDQLGSIVGSDNGVALSSGVADSIDFGPLGSNSYYLLVDYNSSDTGQWLDTSTCEEFSIAPPAASPTVTTEVRDNAESPGISFDLGSIIHDFVTVLTGGNDVPGGSSVSFEFYTGGNCDTGTLSGPVDTLEFGGSPLSSPASGPSDPRGPLHAGDYAYQANFNSGDTGSVLDGTSDCEPFTVEKADTGVSTTVHDASHNAVTSPAPPGDFHDSATVDVAPGSYSGFDLGPIPSNVHFTLYDNSTCNGTVLATEDKTVSGTPPRTVESSATNLGAGTYSYQVLYDGNTDYNGDTSECEAFSVAAPADQITALSDFHGWIGLKNSDDQGTQFDLKVELYDGTTLVASGLKRCITGVTRNPTFAKDTAVVWAPFSPFTVGSNDVLSVKVSTRIGTTATDTKCTGPGGSHNSAVGLRLYYDSTVRASRFDATIGGSNDDYYLRSDGNACVNAESTGVTSRFLSTTAPTVTTVAGAKCKDSASVNFAGGNLWKEIGTWFYTVP